MKYTEVLRKFSVKLENFEFQDNLDEMKNEVSSFLLLILIFIVKITTP